MADLYPISESGAVAAGGKPTTHTRKTAITQEIFGLLKPVQDILSKFSLSEYLEVRKEERKTKKIPIRSVATVKPEDTVGDALKLLSEYVVLAAPIVLCETKPGGTIQYMGFFHVGDVLKALVEEAHIKGYPLQAAKPIDVAEFNAKSKCDFALSDAVTTEALNGDLTGRIEALQGLVGPEFLRRPVISVSQSRKDGEIVYRGFEQATLLNEIKWDLIGSHRIGVFDFHPLFDDGTHIHDMERFEIVSQSDILRFILSQNEKDKPIGELGLGTHDKVLCVSGAAPAISAFALMYNRGVSCVGVCEETSKQIIACLSASDLRCLKSESFGTLALPIKDFLTIQRLAMEPLYRTVVEVPGNRELPPTAFHLLTCRTSTTFEQLLEILVKYTIHQAFIVDEKERPIAVVTLTDVLAFVGLTFEDIPLE